MKKVSKSLAKVPTKTVPVSVAPTKWGQTSKGAGVEKSTVVSGLSTK